MLTSPTDRAGAWRYKNNGQQYLPVLDANQNVLLTVAQNASSTDSTFYDFVGIKYIVITNDDLSVNPNWGVSEATTFFDNFTFGDQR